MPDGSAAAPVAAREGSTSRRSVVVQAGDHSFPDMTAFLVEDFGCERLQLADYGGHLGQSKWTHLKGLARQSLQLLAELPRLRNADCVITVGPVTHGHLLRLLKRLRIVRYRRSIALGFYVHSERFFPLLRLLARLDGPDDRYILFSHWETELYRTRLGIPAERMLFLPYGAWGAVPAGTEAAPPAGVPGEGYYFAGGYSNRDYLPLIEAFSTIGRPLVIICSAINAELDGLDLPPNVTVLRDVSSECFDAYVRHCKACI